MEFLVTNIKGDTTAEVCTTLEDMFKQMDEDDGIFLDLKLSDTMIVLFYDVEHDEEQEPEVKKYNKKDTKVYDVFNNKKWEV